jgi:hypothetical protein
MKRLVCLAHFGLPICGLLVICGKERSAMLKIAPLRKKRYPARGARKKQFPINDGGRLLVLWNHSDRNQPSFGKFRPTCDGELCAAQSERVGDVPWSVKSCG